MSPRPVLRPLAHLARALGLILLGAVTPSIAAGASSTNTNTTAPAPRAAAPTRPAPLLLLQQRDTLADTDTTAVQDTTPRAPDDTVPAGRQEQAADTVERLNVFPSFPIPEERSPGTASAWSQHDILMNGALSPADLIEDATVPLDPVRAGFFEGPQAFVFAGGGPASMRVSMDGYELAPLGGGALDLHSLSLVELGKLRLVREPGGFHLWGQAHRRDRPDPYSRIEGGTGDRDTNMLRAFFSSAFLGSPLGFGFDRVDTDGGPETGAGERASIWAAVARELPLSTWAQLEYRRTRVERDTAASPGRTDWVLRLRRAFGDRWHADLVAGTGSRVDELPPDLDGPDPDAPDEAPTEIERSARQLALRAAYLSDAVRAHLTLRVWDGDGVPDFDPEAIVDIERGPVSIYGSGRYTDWGDHDALAGYGAVRLRLPLGLRATGDFDVGERGLFGDTTGAEISFERWTLGGGLRRLGWDLEVRAGRWKTEPSPGLGVPFDSAISLPGGRAGVLEASAMGRVLDLWGGDVRVGGRYRARDPGAFLYWPQDEWWLEGRYDVLLYGGQLELDLRLLGGVRGPMRVVDRTGGPGAIVLTEPQSHLIGEIAVRVKDVHIYYTYEMFEAAGGPVDVPGFPLPRARTHFGLKWEFWN